jgi:hypothetical protein
VLDLKLIRKEEEGMHSAPAMSWAGANMHPMNRPVAKRHNQLPFNQEVRII